MWIWRGLHEHARVLARAASDAAATHRAALADRLRREGAHVARTAAEMRAHIERSLRTTLDARNPAMAQAGITPFDPTDTTRDPKTLESYENHRFMMDWWTADWGDADLDAGHFRHRGVRRASSSSGMNTDGHYPRTSNFMEHGTLAGRIRQDDYRPFLLALYGNLCCAMDGGSRYAPEDALLPGNYPGEGSQLRVVGRHQQRRCSRRWGSGGSCATRSRTRRDDGPRCTCRKRRHGTGSRPASESPWTGARRASASSPGAPSRAGRGGV